MMGDVFSCSVSEYPTSKGGQSPRITQARMTYYPRCTSIKRRSP